MQKGPRVFVKRDPKTRRPRLLRTPRSQATRFDDGLEDIPPGGYKSLSAVSCKARLQGLMGRRYAEALEDNCHEDAKLNKLVAGVVAHISRCLECLSAYPPFPSLLVALAVSQSYKSYAIDFAWHFRVLRPGAFEATRSALSLGYHRGNGIRAASWFADRVQRINHIATVHEFANGSLEVLILAVRIADCFLSLREIPHHWHSLVGLTAWWIAIKFDDSTGQSLPTFKDLVILGNYEFSAKDVEAMELVILRTLEYRVHGLSVVQHKPLMLLNSHSDHNLVNYITELGLHSNFFPQWGPSAFAAAVVLVSNWILGTPVCPTLVGSALNLSDCQSERDAIKLIMQELIKLLLEPGVGVSTYRKFARQAFSSISVNARALARSRMQDKL